MATEVCARFRSEMHCDLSNVISSPDYIKCNAENERKLAKDRFKVVVDKCCESTGDNEIIVTNNIIKLVTNQIPNDEIQQFMGPIFNAR